MKFISDSATASPEKKESLADTEGELSDRLSNITVHHGLSCIMLKQLLRFLSDVVEDPFLHETAHYFVTVFFLFGFLLNTSVFQAGFPLLIREYIKHL